MYANLLNQFSANIISRLDPQKSCSDLEISGAYTFNSTTFTLDLPLDYEKAGCRETRNSLYDDKGQSVTFKIVLNNLDDNVPQFDIGESCKLMVSVGSKQRFFLYFGLIQELQKSIS